MELDPKAVMVANEMLWKRHPELLGRQLTMGPEDTAYRREWMENYREVANQTPTPPPPRVLPQPVDEKPPAIVSGETCEPCGDIAKMTHEQKMEKAIEAANLGPEIMEELGDIKTLVASILPDAGRRGEAMLRAGLNDADPYCRRRALLALIHLAPEDAPQLRERFLQDPDAGVRQAAASMRTRP